MRRETPVLPFPLNTVGKKSSKEQGEEKKINKKTDFFDLKSKPCAKGRNDILNNNTQFRTISPGRKLIDPSSCKSDKNK